MIKNATRIVCPNKIVKFEISKLNPLDWLNDLSRNNRYSVFDIDGYIINKVKKPTAIFTRLELIHNSFDEFDVKELIEEIKIKYSNKIIYNIKFANLLKIEHWLIVTLNNYPLGFKNDEEGILSFKFILDISNNLEFKTLKKINILQMEKGIKMLRGFSFTNVKSLLSGPSHLSCYLNNETLNPFPGDLDGVVFDNENNRILSIIEFKTHNIDSPIQNEHIGKYGLQDWRRFEVLFNLKDYINEILKYSPKLYYIAWGTRDVENHSKIKIDLLEDGKVKETDYLKRPEFGEFSNELLLKLT